MPGKDNKPKSSAGKSGLSTDATSGGQTPDHSVNPEESSVAAVQLLRQETPKDMQDAALKGFDDLYGSSDGLPAQNPHAEAIDVDKDDEDKDNEEEDVLLLPDSQNFVPGTAEDFTEKLRFNGLRWRHEVEQRAKKDPTLRDFLLWVNNRPSPMEEAMRPLGQMLHDIKNLQGEAEQIVDMGDGYVQMSIATFERHVYPQHTLGVT
jgi:hypothetical protein